MFSTIVSAGIIGVSSFLVQVETDLSTGMPCFEMVGMAGSSVKEARERVKVALKNNGFHLPPVHITVNLSPADVRKDSTAYDLPIAIGLLQAMEEIPAESTKGTLIAGELGLSGEIKPVKGNLPMVMEAAKRGMSRCIIPEANLKEGAVVENMTVYGASHVKEVLRFLKGEERSDLKTERIDVESLLQTRNDGEDDFRDVKGQEVLRRVSLIAAAGFHHFLMIGAPGAGKTMIARRIPSILPDLTPEECLEVSSVYSVAGKLKNGEGLVCRRPFLSPHHTISEKALTGGGNIPKPGVISLAHRGVLFLDELPEYKRQTIDLLRQPLEDKEIQIVRMGGNYVYPTDFLLVCAMNPCPCGHYPDRNKCRCSDNEIRKYLGRISGPILDRIDMVTTAPKVEFDQLSGGGSGESSASMREKIETARKMQKKRYAKSRIRFNSELSAQQLKRYCPLGEEPQKCARDLFESMDLSARGYHRLLRVARTIADLEESEQIKSEHLLEAALYRRADETYWGMQ